MSALAADPAVQWLEPNLPRGACEFPAGDAPPNDPLFLDTRQWALRNAGAAGVYRGLAGADIGALGAWSLTCGDDDLRLAIADTGVDPWHPDLQRSLASGTPRLCFGRNVSTGLASAWADSNSHGTAVAGVMAAFTHDGPHFDSLGIAGVCGGDGHGSSGCRLIPIKISPGGYGISSSWEIARAIVYAASLGARAVNLSFAGGGDTRAERAALYYAITRGCVVAAAIGNLGVSAPTAPQYPAAYAESGLCVAVGASDARDRRALFSSYGPGLDLLAPGLDVWTTAPTYPNAFGARYPGYLSASGTSFAAPHVTGTIGLMCARRPDLTDADFQQLLRLTAHDVGAPGWDAESAWGRLDAAAAVRAADPSFGLWHDEQAARVTPTGRFAPLLVAPDSFGGFANARAWNGVTAELCEASVTVTLPDSFADSARVWPRVGGTMALRGDFRLAHWAPWAEVAAREGRAVTLRGYLYRVPWSAEVAASGAFGAPTPRTRPISRALGLEPQPDSADFWLPLPPDQARIGFTVFGPVERHGPASVPARAAPEARFQVAPNPARFPVRISGPPGARVTVVDLQGRVVLRASLDPSRGEFTWDGRDRFGRRASPGLYFLRGDRATGDSRRLVVLDD
jgi:subtilisin family serine protease